MQFSWCYARDVSLHAEDRELTRERLDDKLFKWLRRHGQETGHIPSIYPFAVGMPIRLTENLDRDMQLCKGRTGMIFGWTLEPNCEPLEQDGEFMLDRRPTVI